jgi:lipopolysaccharide transport system ATP-binding protein
MSESDVVIRVEGLGKKYFIHHESTERYRPLLRDVWVRKAKSAGRLLNPFTLAGQVLKAQRQAVHEHAGSDEDFWALKDVSFEIRRGERVGIIGRNGAGKSTLLKILSRITEPTTGRVEIRGRVASLLEVGTGFHAELTGRENIYLNGAILGMTRREIRAKFDEIVDFSEVEKFLDTPVKRYSSGMYVRLAFAVAAHLEPEILVVDEVLAVGDASFQQKCLGKMQDCADQESRVILFVSHQMNAITRLCSRCLLLSDGNVVIDSKNTKEAINYYLCSGRQAIASSWENTTNLYKQKEVVPLSICLSSGDPRHYKNETFDNSYSIILNVKFLTSCCDNSMNVGIAIYNVNNELLLWSFTTDDAVGFWPKLNIGVNQLKLEIPSHYFNEGTYRLEFLASFHMRKYIIAPGEGPDISFTIKDGLSPSPHWIQARPGIMAPVWRWEINSPLSPAS